MKDNNKEQKQPKNIPLKEGEQVIKSGGGGPISFFGGPKGGYMFLTNKRIFHGKVGSFKCDLNDVEAVRITKFVCIVMVIPVFNCIEITMKGGARKKIQVTKKKEWIQEIENLINV